MDNRLSGSILIVVGLFIAGFGGTAGDFTSSIYYVIGFLIAFVGLGLFLKYWKAHSSRYRDE
ncbi:MAG: hypothetical protein ACTSR2_02195 [Candidatus Hodarchaeales archaeon]